LFAFGVAAIAVAGVDAQQIPDAKRTFSSPADYVTDVATSPATTSELRDLVDRFSLDRQAIQRFYTIPGSTARRDRLRVFYDAWLAKLPAVRFDALSLEGKVDYVLLRSRIEYERALLGREERVRRETGELVPFYDDVAAIQEERQRLVFVDADGAVAALRAVAAKLAAVHARVDSGLTAPPAVALRAAEQVDALNTALAQWFAFYNGYDPKFTATAPASYQSLKTALTDYAALLREKIAGLPHGAGQLSTDAGGRGGRGGNAPPPTRSSEGPIVGDPIGREGLLEDLRGEMIAYTPEQLIEIGNREYAWCEAEMKKASREMGFGDDWMKALEKVKNIYVPRGEQPQLVRNLALEAVAFVRQHDLVTIPPLALDQWRMTMMPEANQRVNPFFLGGETIQVSYPTNTMSEEDTRMVMRGNGPHFSRATVFHELIPGHSLQGFMAARYNPQRQPFTTPFLIEGWALYWEFIMDHGFPRSPEDRVGMLFWRMHRAARIIFSLNFHLGRWTPQQCVDFLVDRVGHERFTAEGEVRRSFNGSYSPLYQVGYMMGALQIRSLMHELVDSKRMTLKAFNDAFLHEGQMPIEMMRVALARLPLTRDYAAQWKYYGNVPDAK
jgi:hypothetical protein